LRFCAGSSWSGLISYAYDLSCTLRALPEHAVSKDGYLLLSTDIWVGALIRRAELAGAFAMVVRKGDPRAGAVLVKTVNRRAGEARLYSEAVRGDGERFWMQPVRSTAEADLDAYVQRSARIDPDLWVVEIEDAEGRHFLTEPVDPA
jgi:hypothetical protein